MNSVFSCIFRLFFASADVMTEAKQSTAVGRKSKLEVADATEAPHRSEERNRLSRSLSVVPGEIIEAEKLSRYRKQSLFAEPTFSSEEKPKGKHSFEW